VYTEANTLFLFPPTLQDLKQRLEKRGTETEESLSLRMKNAQIEIKRGIEKDDPQHLIGYRIINGDLNKASKLFIKMIEILYCNELGI